MVADRDRHRSTTRAIRISSLSGTITEAGSTLGVLPVSQLPLAVTIGVNDTVILVQANQPEPTLATIAQLIAGTSLDAGTY